MKKIAIAIAFAAGLLALLVGGLGARHLGCIREAREERDGRARAHEEHQHTLPGLKHIGSAFYPDDRSKTGE